MKMQRFLIFLLLFIFIPCTVCAEDLSSDKYNEALSDYDLSFLRTVLIRIHIKLLRIWVFPILTITALPLCRLKKL